MSDRRFIIVSNRLPVSVSKASGKLVFELSSGGLAKAMTSLEDDRLWIGWPGIPSDDLSTQERATITKELKKHGCVPVFLTAEQVKNFYEGYANGTIWPLFHYFQAHAKFDNDFWPAYQTVNKLFAKAVAQQAHKQATIWVHDYHLMLLPHMLRQSLPNSSIGFFLHIPFPSFEVFRLLPERRLILRGLLGADLVGFHTYDYARYFMSSVMRRLGYESENGSIALGDRTVVTDAFPIGIDYRKYADGIKTSAAKAELKVLDEHYHDKKIILSVDRLDYTKGIPSRLNAFEEFLERHPRFHKKIVLVMIAVPSRVEVQTYKDLRSEIEQIISRINGKYATLDWTPISYQFKNISFEQLTALYNKAAVALVTPLRDGMNLVAKEYVASKESTPGVLILSELTGAADELQEAIRVNPNNTGAIVDALKAALTMPVKEQKKRMYDMQQRISHYTVQRWAHDFLAELNAAADSPGHLLRVINQSKKEEIVHKFQRAKRRSIFLDYDGTLTDFVSTPNPEQAKPSRALLRLLSTLATLPNTRLHIISGRTRKALDAWFGSLPITLVAEHGAWVKRRGKWVQKISSFDDIKTLVRPIMERYAERTPGASVEEKDFAMVWHYRNAQPELAYARNSSLRHELQTLVTDNDVGIFNGNKIIEIKPHSTQKGAIVSELLKTEPADFVLCAGDDYTDEDMFEALDDKAYTIKVGPGKTHARFHAGSVAALLSLLRSLALATPPKK